MSAATGASAQFSMNTMQPGSEIRMPIRMYPTGVSVDVTNDAKARAIRKAIWRQRNLVDLNVTLTGSMTQFNESWRSNNTNSISGLLVARYYHTYERGRFVYNFKFDASYGMNFIDDVWFKNQDEFRFYNLAQWMIKQTGAMRNWRYSLSFSFNSQFTEGHKSRTEKEIIWSNFMAPADMKLGVGLTYTSPNKKLPFVVTMEPFSSSTRFVIDDRIDPDRRRKLGIPVTEIKYTGEDGNEAVRYDYRNYKSEGGSTLNVSFNRTFRFGKKKGVSLQYITVFNVFYGWITQVAKDASDETPVIMPAGTWTNTLNFNPIKYLTLQFTTTSVYDKSQIDKVQMQYFLKLGLSYSFKNK